MGIRFQKPPKMGSVCMYRYTKETKKIELWKSPRFKGKMLEQSNLRIYFCNIPVTKTKEAKTSQVNSFCVCIHL